MSAVADSSGSKASLSRDGCYRWWLRRCLGTGEGCLLFVGLNPPRADGQRDDPTLHHLIGFARQWGYRELLVLNLLARISPSPAALLRVKDPIGEQNDATLNHWSLTSGVDLWCEGGRMGRDGTGLSWFLGIFSVCCPNNAGALFLTRRIL
ncbi:DUF1643 domain-containing protein [Parasynechococcus sp.]|uniref:DUF1643 domain-containing protein n=1 Tax=Parasynechococcus sp. TaxID=3101203 RepID=UPI0037044505